MERGWNADGTRIDADAARMGADGTRMGRGCMGSVEFLWNNELAMEHEAGFAALRGHRYLSLTTFRKTGKAVPTPVWFAGDDMRIFVWTNAGSGKVKRLRNNRNVSLAPCTYNGRVLGPEIDACAEILQETAQEEEVAEKTLRVKYGWQWRLARLMSRAFRRRSVFLKVVP
jgi:uncharacterized protein